MPHVKQFWRTIIQNNELTTEFNEVEDRNRQSNDETLTSLDPIDACVDVDRICAEDGQHAHVDIVQNTYGNKK